MFPKPTVAVLDKKRLTPTSFTLSSGVVSDTTIALSWTASTDYIDNIVYDVYKDGVFYSTVATTSTSVSGLTASTSYSFFIRARDTLNITKDSNTVVAATSSGGAFVIEGYGSGVTGGAGKTVYHVTNLNASGAGSLANGMVSNRYIVFDVAGTITNFRFLGAPFQNTTIDGTTAPGAGITLDNGIAGGELLSFDGSGFNNIIVRNIRVRNSPGADGINVVNGAHDIVFDHVSVSGNGDGNLDITSGAFNVTVQWCLIGPGVANSSWSGATLIAYTPTKNNTIHHTLYTSTTPGGTNAVGERNPLVHSSNGSPGSNLMVDFRNNVIWKWGRANGTGSGYGSDAAYQGTANFVKNYYYSTSNPSDAIITDGSYGNTPTGSAFCSGNVSGNAGVNPNSASSHAEFPVPAPNQVTQQDACSAASLVLANCGCRPLDAVDQALINAITLFGC